MFLSWRSSPFTRCSARSNALLAHAVERKRGRKNLVERVASDLRKSWENLGNPITRAGLLTGWQSRQRPGRQAGRQGKQGRQAKQPGGNEKRESERERWNSGGGQ